MTPRRYATTAIALHWSIALLVFVNIAAGLWMESCSGPARMQAFQLHMSFGILILLLSLARVGVRLTTPVPPLPAGMPTWQRGLARTVHVAFYVFLLAIPLSGWFMASASPLNLPKQLFGLLPWPDLPVPTSRTLARGAGKVHVTLVFLLYGLVAVHLAGALRHIAARDGTLSRMLPKPAGEATRP